MKITGDLLMNDQVIAHNVTAEFDGTLVLEEEEQETAPLKPSRDPGSWIGNQAWNGVRGDPITGTHFGKLDADGRARRAIKAARHRSNRITRAEENKRRGGRA